MKIAHRMKAVSRLIVTMALALFANAVFAWGQNSPDAGVYGMNNSMMLGSVYEGTVVNVRPVHIESSNTATYTGRATGAALGGLLGSRLGQGNGRIAAGILGAVLGGVAGNDVANQASGYNGSEVIIAMKDHRLVSVTQAGDPGFVPGEPVYVVQSGGTTRVVARGPSQGDVRYIEK